ncbi:HpcH/HpaI aldolase family protein [Streptomyces sp. NPDC002346]
MASTSTTSPTSASGWAQALAGQGTAFGTFALLPCTAAAEAVAATGFDFVLVDQQHGLAGSDALVPLLQALHAGGTAPVVRVPANDPAWIGKALDSGADAVVVPMVESAQEAERAVRACRYPPHGTRSYGPTRAALLRGWGIRRLEDTACLVMIETAAGVAQADAIAATKGVDGIFVGPTDLAISLGLGPDVSPGHPAHEQAVQHVLAACQRAGITAGIQTSTAADAAHRAEQGFRIISARSELALLRSAARDLLHGMRSGA